MGCINSSCSNQAIVENITDIIEILDDLYKLVIKKSEDSNDSEQESKFIRVSSKVKTLKEKCAKIKKT